MSKKYITNSEQEMFEISKDFVFGLKPYKNKAVVVFLYGELGAGKTTFVRGVLRSFKIEENVTSPTFVLMKRYNLDDKNFNTLYHVDAYRLKESERDILGIKKLEKDSQNLIFIEWPDRIYKKSLLRVKRIYFEHGEKENERVINFK